MCTCISLELSGDIACVQLTGVYIYTCRCTCTALYMYMYMYVKILTHTHLHVQVHLSTWMPITFAYMRRACTLRCMRQYMLLHCEHIHVHANTCICLLFACTCRLIQYRGSVESVEMEGMSAEEQDLIRRIRRLQTDLQVMCLVHLPYCNHFVSKERIIAMVTCACTCTCTYVYIIVLTASLWIKPFI